MTTHPDLDRRRSRDVERHIGWCAVPLVAVAAFLGGVVAPPDAIQGQWQRMMYLHVPAAWTAFLAFGVVAVSSVAYLHSRDPRWDRSAVAAAEVGVPATALTLVLGSVWGHAVWGVWWAWDPRLVSTAMLLLIYVAYLGLRGIGRDRARAARRAAVLGIVGFVDVPVVHFSVLWWRTLHQAPTVLAPPTAAPPIEGRMALALAVSVLAVMTTAAWLYLRRLRSLRAADRRGLPVPLASRTAARREAEVR